MDTHLPKIAVVGVGGAGINIVKHMQELGLDGIDFIVANTDAQSLAHAEAAHKITLGKDLTQGFGAGGDPVIGEKAAQESLDEIIQKLSDYQMVFITAGMGGGTGTGAASVIAQAARDAGILTVGLVTRPFEFEGQKRDAIATEGIEKLKTAIDSYLVLHNEKLFDTFDDDVTQMDAFFKADSSITDSLKGLTEILTSHGQINLDFADLRSVLKESGKIVLNSAMAEGENRAHRVAQEVLNNPLLDQGNVEGAQQVLIQISGGTDVTLKEIKIITDEIRKYLPHFGNLMFGTHFKPELDGKIMISLIASGLDDSTPISFQPKKSLDSFSFSKPTDPKIETPEEEPKEESEETVEEKTEVKEPSSDFEDLQKFFDFSNNSSATPTPSSSLDENDLVEDETSAAEREEEPQILAEEEIIIEETSFEPEISEKPSESPTPESHQEENPKDDLTEQEGDLLKMIGAIDENKEAPEDLEIPSFLREMKND